VIVYYFLVNFQGKLSHVEAGDGASPSLLDCVERLEFSNVLHRQFRGEKLFALRRAFHALAVAILDYHAALVNVCVGTFQSLVFLELASEGLDLLSGENKLLNDFQQTSV